jgi:glucan 1,3-beta-glucosidase
VIVDLHGAPGSQNGLDNSGNRSVDGQVENWGDTWLYSEENKQATTQILVQITKWIGWLNTQGMTNVIMLELVNEPWVFGDMSYVRDWYKASITAIKAENDTLPLLIHDAFRHEEWAWLLHHWEWKNIYMDTHLYHAFNINDLASSNPECDKSKMIAHENLACRYGSLLRFKSCVSLPTFTGEWSLTVDNCIDLLQGSTKDANQFLDWGQCSNLESRATDPWWQNHTKSFAMRQIAMFERELGWAFWTYKLGTPAQEALRRNQEWCFHCAVTAGWIDTNYPSNACEHQLGDYPGC